MVLFLPVLDVLSNAITAVSEAVESRDVAVQREGARAAERLHRD
jgi:hypothetical protein